jgi:uncharacterized membrane protein YqjE
MSETDPDSPGLLRSIRGLMDKVLETVQTRLELVGLELREERGRLWGLLVASAAGLILGTVGGVVLTVALALALPSDWRVGTLAACGIIYLAAAAILLLRVRSRLKHGPPPFAETVLQIKKDREWLSSNR